MSENITIKEGGIAQGFGGVTVLRTSNGDGYDQWVPKKDVNTKSVTFKKNGKYATRAYLPDKGEKITVDNDVYGYSSVTVSVTKKTKGKKKKVDPTTGEEYDAPYSVDVDDAGNLTEKELPTSIRITTKPDRTRFREGEEINTNGMVVHAYYADGSDWGIVPKKEIEIEPKIAELAGGGEEIDADALGLNNPIYKCKVGVGDIYLDSTDPDTEIKEINGDVYAYLFEESTRYICIYASNEESSFKVARKNGAYPETVRLQRTTYEEEVYYQTIPFTSSRDMGRPYRHSAPQQDYNAAVAKATLHGEYKTDLDVTVKWDMDGELDEKLTDDYTINVYGRH